ncbi:LysR family transcriptional regulator [Pantoea rodasii]|uniref:LysR family transcriptional regulator n=1 Tax=Pantoea rodasii TaxID=1076549 RepID=A0A2M9WIN0_9GAMM|nr:LysR family transcriptional regulator [Pantoea rodasii]ORM64287.1 LysR family transcriptional regulator [Pantoea rodasii]PJZ07425.1 LysR family transcriptional regulator [Pantoea rodasii]
MDSLNGFIVFVQVAETRSFVSAGRHLGISASAVGKSIARLEDRLGVRLFHRSTRSITLTAEGALFLERSRRILAEIEAAESELSQAAQRPTGRLKLSFPMVSSLILPALGDFMTAYPDIQLDLDFSDRLVDVIAEGYDAVMRGGPPMDSRLSARKLGYAYSIAVASPEYLARHGTPQTPEDLQQHSCLHYRFNTTGKLERWVLRGYEDEQELALPSSMVCNNIETRVCFAMRGLGIAMLPDFSVREALAQGTLVAVLNDYACHRNVFHLLWPASKHPSPKVRALIDFLSTRVFTSG